MVTIGGQGPTIYGNQARVTFNGNLYAACNNYSFKLSFKTDEDDVIGSPFPIMSTASFRGSGKMVLWYSTDAFNNSADFIALLTPVNGQIPPVNFRGDFADALGTPGTPSTHSRSFVWTGTLWPTDGEITQNGTDKPKLELTFKFSSMPVES